MIPKNAAATNLNSPQIQPAHASSSFLLAHFALFMVLLRSSCTCVPRLSVVIFTCGALSRFGARTTAWPRSSIHPSVHAFVEFIEFIEFILYTFHRIYAIYTIRTMQFIQFILFIEFMQFVQFVQFIQSIQFLQFIRFVQFDSYNSYIHPYIHPSIHTFTCIHRQFEAGLAMHLRA